MKQHRQSWVSVRYPHLDNDDQCDDGDDDDQCDEDGYNDDVYEISVRYLHLRLQIDKYDDGDHDFIDDNDDNDNNDEGNEDVNDKMIRQWWLYCR